MFLVMREKSSSPKEVLTKTQQELALQLVETDLDKQIADARGISEGTMRKHAENIYLRPASTPGQSSPCGGKRRRPS